MLITTSRGQNFVLGFGLGLEHLSSACPRNFYFGLVKTSVMMELVVIVSLQWWSTKVIYLLTLWYWYKLVQVHVHDSIWWGIHRLSIDSEIVLGLGFGLKGLSSFNITADCRIASGSGTGDVRRSERNSDHISSTRYDAVITVFRETVYHPRDKLFSRTHSATRICLSDGLNVGEI